MLVSIVTKLTSVSAFFFATNPFQLHSADKFQLSPHKLFFHFKSFVVFVVVSTIFLNGLYALWFIPLTVIKSGLNFMFTILVTSAFVCIVPFIRSPKDFVTLLNINTTGGNFGKADFYF